jgi:hypothetical protein
MPDAASLGSPVAGLSEGLLAGASSEAIGVFLFLPEE